MLLARKTAGEDTLFQQTFHIYIGAFIGGNLFSILIYYSDINFIILDNLNNPWILDDFQTIAIIILFQY